MMENCPKCGKEIAEADIEGKRAYCDSCREWFARKEVPAEIPPNKEESRLNNDIAEKSIQKERHIIVSIWLWLSIIANILVIIILFFGGGIFGEIISGSKFGVFSVLLGIAIIIGNIFVLKWKIIGLCINIVAIVYMYSVFVNDDPYFYIHYTRISTMLPGILTLAIYFGILNIMKNGISTLRHLLNEAKANKRKTLIWFAAVFGSIFVALLIAVFPVKKVYGNIIVMFAPERIMRPDFDRYYNAWLYCNPVLKTEYGEIRVKFFANVTMFRDELEIHYENFEYGRASHYLVVAGIQMPKHLMVGINTWYKQTEITRLGVRQQNLTISGITVVPDGYIRMSYWDGVTIPLTFKDEYITLADSTQIYVSYFAGDLNIQTDYQRWKLTLSGGGWFSSLRVMLPGETASTSYKSITFGENWGDFIQGDLLVE